MTTMTSDSTVTDLEDRLAIIELVGRLSLAIDGKDWDAMAQLFTETVYHDRTSLTGGDPYTAPVTQFVEGWQRTPDGWRISGLTFKLQWATGNMNVLTLSMAAGA